MLEAVYPYYDIIIWSASSMKWIEEKMKLMSLDVSPRWKITAYFDHSAMITVNTDKYGVINTKPLCVVWGIFPQHYSHKNTIMFDDLRRNFLMNPGNGLCIKAFRNGPTSGREDTVLLHLTDYLLLIKDLNSFSSLDHNVWEAYISRHKKL
eukprot:TRINITY_DN1755_c0_g1_i5.p1 TRINITY_DN1755_c0_g1~~TRINITY_DN1755_c0_g1_i5.p1  ORF type:complete len:151 (+),score=25.43 TRINITY_DN1755_c0_g1_i5:189-641(+)